MKFTIAIAARVLGLILGGVVFMIVDEVRKKSPWYAVYETLNCVPCRKARRRRSFVEVAGKKWH